MNLKKIKELADYMEDNPYELPQALMYNEITCYTDEEISDEVMELLLDFGEEILFDFEYSTAIAVGCVIGSWYNTFMQDKVDILKRDRDKLYKDLRENYIFSDWALA